MGDIYDFGDDEGFDFRKEQEKQLRRYRDLRQKLEATFPAIVEYIDLAIRHENFVRESVRSLCSNREEI